MERAKGAEGDSHLSATSLSREPNPDGRGECITLTKGPRLKLVHRFVSSVHEFWRTAPFGHGSVRALVATLRPLVFTGVSFCSVGQRPRPMPDIRLPAACYNRRSIEGPARRSPGCHCLGYPGFPLRAISTFRTDRRRCGLPPARADCDVARRACSRRSLRLPRILLRGNPGRLTPLARTRSSTPKGAKL